MGDKSRPWYDLPVCVVVHLDSGETFEHVFTRADAFAFRTRVLSTGYVRAVGGEADLVLKHYPAHRITVITQRAADQ